MYAAKNKGANQTARVRELICANVVRILTTSVRTKLQLNLFEATIHLGDMEIANDRWLLIAE